MLGGFSDGASEDTEAMERVCMTIEFLRAAANGCALRRVLARNREAMIEKVSQGLEWSWGWLRLRWSMAKV
jgi:hypothetical protein